MSGESEHPSYAAWDELTGPQRRLVQAFLDDLATAVDVSGLRPVLAPDAAYLMETYGVSRVDAEAVARWCTRSRQEDAMEERVRIGEELVAEEIDLG